MIEYRALGKRFWKGGKPVQAIDNLSFSVAKGEFVSVVGPSGCGKSTLLNLAAGLMAPTSGEVRYAGEPVRDVNHRVGYMTQKDSLMPWRTVEGNVDLALRIQGVARGERRDRTRHYINLVGLGGFEQHYPGELSGGMRKRVALARLLVYDPETLLMDEPFGALDAQLKMVMHEELLAIRDRTNKTIVFVTHDLTEAVTLSDRVVVLAPRPGRVKLIHEVPLERPRNVFQIRFTPRFGEIFETLWSAIEQDMRKGEEV
ncbi:MAG: ABC transporter ATP-binding protein [Alphaproteobacteria bacterium]|nr:ABC transporter ATP-binding protein [Alphaproteobacteria bacterium]